MEQKLISVIVPIYNVEKYLKKSIDSVINQTYQNLEIILVDDGSTDSCPKICDEYKQKDKRIKVIHKENGGLSDARNAGLEVAEGEWVAYMDSDDYLKEDTYEKLSQALMQADADIAICNFEVVNPEGEAIKERNKNQIIKDEILSGTEAIRRLCGNHYEYYVTAWNRLYKKNIAKRVKFPKGKIHEDEYTAHLFYSEAKKVACVSDACYQYVVREDSIMTKKYSVRNLDYFEALNNRIRYCILHEIDDIVAPFVRWMLKNLILSYKKLDMRQADTCKKYKECKAMYFKLYNDTRNRYPLGIKAKVVTNLYRVSPFLCAKLIGK